VINTAHELGAALGVALVSTIAGASVEIGSAAAQAATTGFGHAFLASAILAGLVAVAALWLLPAGRLPAGDGPVFAH
jgi:flagellar motor component MotA